MLSSSPRCNWFHMELMLPTLGKNKWKGNQREESYSEKLQDPPQYPHTILHQGSKRKGTPKLSSNSGQKTRSPFPASLMLSAYYLCKRQRVPQVQGAEWVEINIIPVSKGTLHTTMQVSIWDGARRPLGERPLQGWRVYRGSGLGTSLFLIQDSRTWNCDHLKSAFM